MLGRENKVRVRGRIIDDRGDCIIESVEHMYIARVRIKLFKFVLPNLPYKQRVWITYVGSEQTAKYIFLIRDRSRRSTLKLKSRWTDSTLSVYKLGGFWAVPRNLNEELSVWRNEQLRKSDTDMALLLTFVASLCLVSCWTGRDWIIHSCAGRSETVSVQMW